MVAACAVSVPAGTNFSAGFVPVQCPIKCPVLGRLWARFRPVSGLLQACFRPVASNPLPARRPPWEIGVTIPVAIWDRRQAASPTYDVDALRGRATKPSSAQQISTGQRRRNWPAMTFSASKTCCSTLRTLNTAQSIDVVGGVNSLGH